MYGVRTHVEGLLCCSEERHGCESGDCEDQHPLSPHFAVPLSDADATFRHQGRGSGDPFGSSSDGPHDRVTQLAVERDECGRVLFKSGKPDGFSLGFLCREQGCESISDLIGVHVKSVPDVSFRIGEPH